MTQRHPFHLVDPSPWPLVRSSAAFRLTTGAVAYRHGYAGGGLGFVLALLRIVACRYVWWRDIVREATLEGQHTGLVQLGLRLGRVLFMVSEVRFFFAFFWAYFWAAVAPTPEIGSVWPPKGMEVLSAWEIPLLNTLILLTSGASVTWAHHARVAGDRSQAITALLVTIALATGFTALQGFEYLHAGFTMSDGIYGSTFYRTTGFHGLHVFIGTCFLAVCLARLASYHFTSEHHFGFEAAAWYWHFVDVVWLFLFVAVYWWGGH